MDRPVAKQTALQGSTKSSRFRSARMILLEDSVRPGSVSRRLWLAVYRTTRRLKTTARLLPLHSMLTSHAIRNHYLLIARR